MTPERRTTLLRILAIILVIGVTIFVFCIRDRARELGALGYPGLFLLSIIANATVIIPVPGILITSAMGAVFNPFWVAIATGSGAAIGEITGYLAGFSGQAVIENVRFYERLLVWMKKYGDWIILILSFVPNPVFDMAGLAAGALKLPIWKFLIFCCIGKILKMMAFAYFGASIMGLFNPK
jgi:uncharacterized membrane protein YdjX (TVP38/TMEM64 family)